jgi:2-polyprenyl-3-methyl-5-hydroxy-6-metoxy-1,4-benzoquinol methylase
MPDGRDIASDTIAAGWEAHPVGDDFVREIDWREHFLAYDKFKYSNESHILDEIARLDLKGKRVLEIGLGQGAESQKLIQAGALYTGIDFTRESVERVKRRCAIFGLPYEAIEQMNAEAMSFAGGSFDVVFSHGVIHHSPRVDTIVKEIHRVLRPGGRAVVMVYHRNSLNYHVSIRVIRRLGIALLYVPGAARVVSALTREPVDRLLKHRTNLRSQGLSYLRMDRFVHKATDGPDNVYSKVFSEGEARALFAGFTDVATRTHLLNERHFPVLRSVLSASMKRNLAAKFGWHLWLTATKAGA